MSDTDNIATPKTDSPDNGTAAPVTLSAAEVQTLRQQAAERDQYLDLARRTQAEFANYQKRQGRDRDLERDQMTAGLMSDLLPVLDNLERALSHAQKAGEQGSLVQGVSLVRGQFLELLKRHNVTPLEAQVGQPFDPNLHQALAQQPSAEHPANTLLLVAEQGYRLKDRVLRPAKVVVSTTPS